MKLLSVLRARSIWYVYLSDLNPGGINIFSSIPLLVERYKFLQFPTKIEDLDTNKGIKFVGGNFKKEQMPDIAVDLSIFNDGFVADTRSSTKDSDAFLNDLLNWAVTKLGLVPYPEILRSKVYINELWVQTDKHLNTLNPKLDNFAKSITSLIVGHEYHKISYETVSLNFWTESTILNPPPPFKFERAEAIPFEENRYYSIAPLQTDIHIKMLEDLEDILSS